MIDAMTVPWNGTRYHRVDVNLNSVSFFITSSKSELLIPRKTSDIAKANHLQLCVNGDGFFYVGNKVHPMGVAYSQGKGYNRASRDERTLYISKRNLVSFTRRGVFWNAISFPNWLVNGGLAVNHNLQDVASRTIIGLKDERMIFIVVDGIEGQCGATLNQAADLCMQLGCENAINLDGGGSSTMVVNGEIVNVPSDNNTPGQERPVCNHIGVK